MDTPDLRLPELRLRRRLRKFLQSAYERELRMIYYNGYGGPGPANEYVVSRRDALGTYFIFNALILPWRPEPHRAARHRHSLVRHSQGLQSSFSKPKAHTPETK